MGRNREASAPVMRAAGIALVLLAAAGAALACGVCLEDKIAATYDAAVIAGARAHGHVVAFVTLAGGGVPIAASGPRAVGLAFAGVPGVDPGTVRVSAEHAAASFAYDPARHSLASLLRAARPRLASLRLSADSIRVMGSVLPASSPAGRAATAVTAARRRASIDHQGGTGHSR